MARLKMDVMLERHPLAAPFRISGYLFDVGEGVLVTLSDGEHRGRGEGSGVYYLGDDQANMARELETHRTLIEAGISREELLTLMPPGGARNAVDCALWELEADQRRMPVWAIAGIGMPKPVITTFTLGADDPAKMADGARGYADAQAIKLKLTGDPDLDGARVRAVREARPDVWLGVDANQGFTIAELREMIPLFADSRVDLIEQPLKRGNEADLEGFHSPIPIAADESALVLADVEGMIGRFDVLNIKLDKCGGLTEALMMADRGKALGLDIMVGNMVGTSLAMAPAFILAQQCRVVDLDGPTFLARDRTPSIVYRDGTVWSGDEVWGPQDAAG